MGFSRQEYWSRLPCPPPGDLPNPGTEPRSPASQADSLPYEHACLLLVLLLLIYLPGPNFSTCITASKGVSQVALVVKNPPANAGDIGDTNSIPGSGRSPGGHDNPLQYSCLENPMDGGAWWAIVHRVAKSQTHTQKWVWHNQSDLTHTHNSPKEYCQSKQLCPLWSLQGKSKSFC